MTYATICVKDTAIDIYGPFDTEAEAIKAGSKWSKENNGDFRWNVIKGPIKFFWNDELLED